MGVDFRYGLGVWVLRVRCWVGLGGVRPCMLTLLYFRVLSLSTISRASAERAGGGRGCDASLRLFSFASAL